MISKFRKILILGLALVIVLSLSACTGSGSGSGSTPDTGSVPEVVPEEVFTLTYATGNGSENGTYQNVEKVFLDKLQENSNGRIVIEEYIGGTLFASGQAFEGARKGSCDIAFDMTAAYAGQFPVTALLEQSCAGPVTASSACALINEFREKYASGLPEYDGVEPLILMNAGPACLFGNKPIRAVGDIKGQQIRTNATNNVAIEKLGGTPVIIGMNEVYDAFSTNTIDSGWFVPEAMYGFSLYEVANYGTVWPYNQSVILIVMNSDTFTSLPPDLQQIVKDTAKDVFENDVMGYFDSTFEEFLGMAAEKNDKFEVIRLPQSDLDAVTEALWPFVEEYANKIEGEGHKGIEVMNWMQERAAYYNSQYPG